MARSEAETRPVQAGSVSLRVPAAMATGLSTGPGYQRLEDVDRGAVLEVSSRPASPDPQGLLDRLPGLVELLQSSGLEVDKLRARRRAVAGLQGEEVALGLRQGTTTCILCTWAGERSVVDADRLVLQFSFSDQQGLASWDEVLDSADTQRER